MNIFRLCETTLINDLIIVNFQQVAKLPTCHGFLLGYFSLKAGYDGLSAFLIEAAEMSGQSIWKTLGVARDECVDGAVFCICLLGIKLMSVFEFNNVTILPLSPPLEYQEVRLGIRKIQGFAFLDLLFGGYPHPIWHDFLRHKIVQIVYLLHLRQYDALQFRAGRYDSGLDATD